MNEQAHKIIVVFQPEIDLDEQKELMKRIGALSSQTEESVCRQTFYTEVDSRWNDYIIWRDLTATDASIENAKTFLEAASLFAKIDRAKSVWSRYIQVE